MSLSLRFYKIAITSAILCSLVLLAFFSFDRRPKFVSVKLQGQFGNQLFLIATAYAYSLDQKLPLIIPQLAHDSEGNIASNAKKLFLDKIDHRDLPTAPFAWKQRSFHRYSRIPKKSNIQLEGYFQDEKYFKHRRKEILELFTPSIVLREEILEKYPFLNSDTLTVAVQVRDYLKEYPTGDYHPTHGREYYAKALAQFPDDAIFLVSSNHLQFAKECTFGLKDNIIYLDEQDYIKEFYTLVLCKSFVISNSSFGWWAAWLSTSEKKTIIAPQPWFTTPYRPNKAANLLPPGTVAIESTPLRACL